MFVVTVSFEIKPHATDNFMALMKDNARQSLSLEEECLVFDVCRSEESSDVVFLYEVYKTSEAFQSHLTSDHFLAFNKLAADMVQSKSISTYIRSTL